MSGFETCRVLGFAAAALVSFGACGGKEGRSTPASCFSGALLKTQLSANVATMARPTFSICRNETTCYAWAPSALPVSGSGGTSEYVTDKASVFATLWRDSQGSVTLDVEWRTNDPSELRDGDHYVVTLAEGAGAPTTVFDKTALYSRITSTGLDSGTACLQAKLSA